jgi:hypothetical protein
MFPAHHRTDDEYQRLFGHASPSDADGRLRAGRVPRDMPPTAPTGQRAQGTANRWPLAPPDYCSLCQRMRIACVCDLDYCG